MTTAVQHRRGTTAEHASFTGLEGEVTIDTTKDTAVIHDGTLAGGYPLAKENLANVSTSGLSSIDGASTASDDKFFIYDQSATSLKTITRAELNNAIEQDALANVAITGGTINGTTIGGTTAAAVSATTLTTSSTVTLNGGTANGVAYLNGSKVLTTGSALTFNGTNLGIGTSSPTTKLDVNGSTYNPLVIRRDGGTDANTGVVFQLATNYWNVGAGTDGNFGIVYNSANLQTSTQFRITSAGNVGIGTSSPNVKLKVSGGGIHANALAAQGSADSYADGLGLMMYYSSDVGYLRAYNNTSGTGTASIAMMTAGSERMRIDASGNVGIGTSSPTNRLSVSGSANITGNTTLGDATTDTVTVNGYMGVGGAPSASTALTVSSTALTSTQQFGVSGQITGSSAATSLVAGVDAYPQTANASFTTTNVAGFYARAGLKGASNTASNWHGLYIADQTQGTNNYGITSAVSSGTNKWNIYASGTAANYFAGNVGVGTSSPTSPLHVVGAAGYVGTFDGATDTRIDFKNSGTRNGIIQSSSASFNVNAVTAIPLIFLTSSAERLRIDSSGNVGIGTSSPEQNLEVVGPSGGEYFRAGGGSVAPRRLTFSSFDAGASDVGHRITAQGGTTTPGVIAFATGNNTTVAERLRIDGIGNVGIGTTSPNASAILDVQSTTKGVRMPNMTTAQKNAIASPAAGLMVFDTTLSKLCVYTGAAWETITSA